ncbi:uncharacterized protein [Physcomitrium patens]|uniref:Pentacotripeptide-repeat region of PRORP domain-containing protein n=1 Tax=Physcomitrium patens TaxID=3218 RepID=A0A2K1KV47_PHYPA|nr:pentatricopeptide repeat-containing protein At5g50280, chloroplastic-like [Physcomitrium patens]PNR57663.1 hypothetical protein PHYPA_004657 [Physcomitrium patens]|eukprot:XP_024370653.1 pentatricopeptide repeat-containing protein At5g50280, chloroplastic-like [Physcomitrella patens]
MELRALGGLQQGGIWYQGFGSTHGGFPASNTVGAQGPRNSSLWGYVRCLERRGLKGGALVSRCSIETEREADAGRVIDGLYPGPGDSTSVDEVSDFWEYEATRHSKDVRTEGAELPNAFDDKNRSDDGERPHGRAEYVMPKVKYTRESKGLKPSYRVFSRDRQTSPKPRINPYSVLLKMIDPANDDEYQDSDSRWKSSVKLKGSSNVVQDAKPGEEFLSSANNLVNTVENSLQEDEALGTEQDGNLLLNFKSFDIGEDTGHGLKWHPTSGDGGDELFDRIDDVGSSIIGSMDEAEEPVSSYEQNYSTKQCGDEGELKFPYALSSTEDNFDEEDELLTGFDNRLGRLGALWSDSEDDDDEDDDFDESELARNWSAESAKEEASDGEDPLRKFLNSRSGNRDSKNEGRVYKYYKAARKPIGVHLNTSGLSRSRSSVIGKEVLYPVLNLKDKDRLVCRANPEDTENRINRSSDVVVDLTPMQHGENQRETSAIREVLQISYNLPQNRVLEDYMGPFVNKFSNVQANIILEALCGDDLTEQVLSFFRWVRLHEPCLCDPRSFTILFTFLGRMAMPDQALVFFGMLPKDKQFHSVHVYNTLITCLTNCNRQDEVPSILEKMQRWGNEPDSVTFSVLMNSAVKGGGSLKEVWALYQDMVQRGISPSVSVFGTFIKAFCDAGRLKEALLITTEMEKLNVPFNVVIYNILIDAYGRVGQLEEAEGLMTEMRERGIQPNVGTYNALITGYLEAKPKRQFVVAEGLIEEMEASGLYPDVVTFTMLLGAYGHEGLTEQAEQVFNRMKARGVQPNSYSYTALINAYAERRCPEKAARAFEMIRKQGVNPTVETYTALLDAYRRAGDLEMVQAVWKSMKVEGCVATRVTYMTILDAFQKQGRYKEARDLIEEFKNQGHKPDLMVYNMLLNSYMRGGRHVKASDILLEMKTAGFLPDSFTYCTLIYGFLRVRDQTKALKYHREMMNRGQLPDPKTYAKLRAILKVVEKRRDENNLKSRRGKSSNSAKKGTEKSKSLWKPNP